MPLLLGTRGSALALWQANWVRAQLLAAWPNVQCELKIFTTTGDTVLDKPLPAIGGKGLFTAELENALRQGEIDFAVHSLKDLPIENAPGLTVGAIGEREDARDGLIARPDLSVAQTGLLAALPAQARVGTSSVRRAAQLLAARPDLQLLPLRGNVDTRVRKALSGEYDAIVLACAGLKRLGLATHITEYLSFDQMLPAPGQGAVAIQCRADDTATLDVLRAVDHAPTHAAVTAERAFLQALGGGCTAPVAAYCRLDGQRLHLTALVAAVDGQNTIRVIGTGTEALTLGQTLAQQVLAQGALELMTCSTP